LGKEQNSSLFRFKEKTASLISTNEETLVSLAFFILVTVVGIESTTIIHSPDIKGSKNVR